MPAVAHQQHRLPARVAFAGPMASGKSTAAAALHHQGGHTRLSLAEPVYEIARRHFGMVAKDRRLLQTIGTTGRAIDVHLWVERLLAGLDGEGGGRYVVDDVRFPEECERLRREGFLVVYLEAGRGLRESRLRRLYGEEDAREHIAQMDSVSETSLSPRHGDVVWRTEEEEGEDRMQRRVSQLAERRSK